MLTRRRQAVSLVVGAAIGGAVTSVPAVFSMTEGYAFGSFKSFAVMWPYAMVIMSGLWFVGIVVLGLPAWFLLERLKLGRWWVAALTGMVLALSPAFLILSPLGVWVSDFDQETLPTILILALPLGVTGGAVGLSIWKYAYRWQVEPDAFD